MIARYWALTAAALGLLSCSETGQEHVEIPLSISGTDLDSPILVEGDVPVTLTRADLAFGPLYLCAGTSAGDLCDTARLEWLETRVVDALNGEREEVGELGGVTGAIQSYMYDLSISSQLTRKQPFVLDAAESLGDNSLVLEGSADVGGVVIPFSADIPIFQGEDAEQGIPVVRKSQSEEFYHEVDGEKDALLVRFDAAPWLTGVDFREFLEDESCQAGGPEQVCAGQVELTCDPDGNLIDEQDCASSDEICAKGIGCVEQLILTPDDAAYRAIRTNVVAGERPAFEWGEAQ